MDLMRPGLSREKMLAAVVRLMERTLARVGNLEYARQNESFGLTTLQNHHVRSSLQVVKQVAKQLGNTPAVCRKCYIHPAVLESYLAGSLQLKRADASEEQALGMWAIERELIRFLERRRRENRSGVTLTAALRASLKATKSTRARAARR